MAETTHAPAKSKPWPLSEEEHATVVNYLATHPETLDRVIGELTAVARDGQLEERWAVRVR